MTHENWPEGLISRAMPGHPANEAFFARRERVRWMADGTEPVDLRVLAASIVELLERTGPPMRESVDQFPSIQEFDELRDRVAPLLGLA